MNQHLFHLWFQALLSSYCWTMSAGAPQDTAGRWRDAIIDLPSSSRYILLDKIQCSPHEDQNSSTDKASFVFRIPPPICQRVGDVAKIQVLFFWTGRPLEVNIKVDRSPSPTRPQLHAERWSQQPPGIPSLVRRLLRGLAYSTSKNPR